MTEIMQHTARVTVKGTTIDGLQALAIQEFAKLFNERDFSLTVTGPAVPGTQFTDGQVYSWDQEYEATCRA